MKTEIPGTGLQIKRLAATDIVLFIQLIRLFETVFEAEAIRHKSEAYLSGLLLHPTFIAYAAVHQNEAVGGITAYELPLYYEERSEVFIYDLAVSTRFQRKGLGKKLLLALKEHCTQNNISQLFVAANEEDEHALDFYRSTQGKAEKVVHFNYEC